MRAGSTPRAECPCPQTCVFEPVQSSGGHSNRWAETAWTPTQRERNGSLCLVTLGRYSALQRSEVRDTWIHLENVMLCERQTPKVTHCIIPFICSAHERNPGPECRLVSARGWREKPLNEQRVFLSGDGNGLELEVIVAQHYNCIYGTVLVT